MANAEDDLVQRLFVPLATSAASRGLLDDAADITPPAGADIVLTLDTIAEGVHFPVDADPADIAVRALGVNLSDLAAKGATPFGYMMSLSTRPGTPFAWYEAFAAALGGEQARHGLPLLGGDTITADGPVTVSITALGTVPAGGMTPRGGARPGDRIFVTGTIGDAALGLMMLDPGAVADVHGEVRAWLVDRYQRPQPRTPLASAVQRFARAAMDISDGLAVDLDRMCAASGVGATVFVETVPLSAPATLALVFQPDLMTTCITGGDDYELLMAVPPANIDALVAAAAQAGIQITEIGQFIRAGGARFLSHYGGDVALPSRGYSHIR
ncbi:MAG: thiamine-phosphate kinase [Flavobacteriaceae bacterium]